MGDQSTSKIGIALGSDLVVPEGQAAVERMLPAIRHALEL